VLPQAARSAALRLSPATWGATSWRWELQAARRVLRRPRWMLLRCMGVCTHVVVFTGTNIQRPVLPVCAASCPTRHQARSQLPSCPQHTGRRAGRVVLHSNSQWQPGALGLLWSVGCNFGGLACTALHLAEFPLGVTPF
jgi:hypothetical protein